MCWFILYQNVESKVDTKLKTVRLFRKKYIYQIGKWLFVDPDFLKIHSQFATLVKCTVLKTDPVGSAWFLGSTATWVNYMSKKTLYNMGQDFLDI